MDTLRLCSLPTSRHLQTLAKIRANTGLCGRKSDLVSRLEFVEYEQLVNRIFLSMILLSMILYYLSFITEELQKLFL